MSRARLNELGLSLPLLPTTTVGSFPKPPELMTARAQFARGKVSRNDLRRLEERATAHWLEVQERLGIDVVVDGEQYRGDMVAYFAEYLPGFTQGGFVRSYGNRYYHKPIITGPIEWTGPLTVDWWRWTQQHTGRPVKGMLTGAYTIMDWSFNEYYPDRKGACIALAHAIRREVEALIEAGARIIQLDEPALSVRSDELRVAVEAMQIMTEGLPAYFITHICYGDFASIYPGMLDLAVDNFDLETANSRLDIFGLMERAPFTKDLSFGVLDVHNHAVESPEAVRHCIEQALQHLPVDRVWVDPDCGLKTRTVDESEQKLAVMMDVVKGMREELKRPD